MPKTTTYNPIIEQNELRSIRLSAIRSPALGTTLVLEPHVGEALVIVPGQLVPAARIGKYKRSYVIDMNQYELMTELSLPSRDPSFLFCGTLSFTCRVRQPDLVAYRGITDVTAALRLPFMRLLRRVAWDFDISESNYAEARLGEVLEPYPGDDAIAVGGYLVELSSGSAASQSNAEWHDANRKIRLDDLRRQGMRATARGGPEALIEDLLANHGGDPAEVLEMLSRSKALEVEQILTAMEIMATGEKNGEPFDTVKERRKLLEHVVNGGSGDRQSSHTSRRSRLAGSLTKSLESAAGSPAKSMRDGKRRDTEPERTGKPGDRDKERPKNDGARKDDGSHESRKSRVRGIQVVEPDSSTG